jgi:hypothetical protein
MARFKNTVADVEAKLITKKNTVLVMQEDVQVVLGKSGLAEQDWNFLNSSTSGLVGKWLYDHYLKLMNNCVHLYLDE